MGGGRGSLHRRHWVDALASSSLSTSSSVRGGVSWIDGEEGGMDSKITSKEASVGFAIPVQPSARRLEMPIPTAPDHRPCLHSATLLRLSTLRQAPLDLPCPRSHRIRDNLTCVPCICIAPVSALPAWKKSEASSSSARMEAAERHDCSETLSRRRTKSSSQKTLICAPPHSVSARCSEV